MAVVRKDTEEEVKIEAVDLVNDEAIKDAAQANLAARYIPLKITSAYLVLALLWILFFDRLINTVIDEQFVKRIELLKESLYIAVTAVILYMLVLWGTNVFRKSNQLMVKSCMELKRTYEELGAVEEELRSQLDELQEKEKELCSSEERIRLAMEGSNDDIWDWDIGKDEAIVSERWRAMLGIEGPKSLKHYEKWVERIHPQDVNKAVTTLKQHFAGKSQYYYCEYRLRLKNGEYIWVLGRGKVLFDGKGNPVRMAGSHTDICERKDFEKKIQQLAYFDSLTDLPNRVMFEENLRESIAQVIENDKAGAVIIIGLDNFKAINDTYGHGVGDLLLKEVSTLLQMCLKDRGTIARFGGDEFAIIYHSIDGILELTEFADAIVVAFRRPWIIDHREIYSTVSMGIALYPRDGKDMDTIVKNAHSAVHYVKEEGRDGYQFYTPKMNMKLSERLELESKLRGALERQELYLLYQPQIDIKSGKIVGVEALIRWRLPEVGVISPAEFIPVAETSGLIVPIGEWVLRTACLQCVKWKKMGIEGIGISVNLSVRQFQQFSLKARIEETLSETNLDPSLLELEITESIAMKDLESAIYTMKQLSSLGIKLSLDDFGTGYSSLNYLKRLPINTLKIDKSFLCQLTEGSSEDSIAQAIIHLSHSMNLTVVAEGVESQSQLEFLKQNNCDIAQGYLFAAPLDPEKFENMYWNYNEAQGVPTSIGGGYRFN